MKKNNQAEQKFGPNFCYYYLHTNGELIHKTCSADPFDFEESDLVVRWWMLDLDQPETALPFLIDAFRAGANHKRIVQLSNDWNFTPSDRLKLIRAMAEHAQTEPEQRVCIFDPERQMWWKQNQHGYTPDWQNAGKWPLSAAQKLIAGPCTKDVTVNENDVMTFNRPKL